MDHFLEMCDLECWGCAVVYACFVPLICLLLAFHVYIQCPLFKFHVLVKLLNVPSTCQEWTGKPST
jgi:hypothetical protein